MICLELPNLSYPLKFYSELIFKKICKGDYSCFSCYIDETKCNAEVRWNEHNNPTQSSESLKHLCNNINHCFTWTVFPNVPKMQIPGRTERHFILLCRPLILENKRILNYWFYLEMVSHRTINDITLTP